MAIFIILLRTLHINFKAMVCFTNFLLFPVFKIVIKIHTIYHLNHFGVFCCSVQFSRSVVSLCNPMNCSTPGLPVHHHLNFFLMFCIGIYLTNNVVVIAGEQWRDPAMCIVLTIFKCKCSGVKYISIVVKPSPPAQNAFHLAKWKLFTIKH